MKKILTLKTMGLIALVMAIGLNYMHAINDYGILENKLHWKVLGQTSSSGDGSSGSSGGDKLQIKCPPFSGCQAGGCGSSSCEIEVSGLLGSEKLKVEAKPGYFACCYKEWGQCYAQTFSQSHCCLW